MTVEETAVGLFGGRRVGGFLIAGDVRLLRDEVRALPPNPRILEIGSWKGLSACVMADARPDAVIHCVDTWAGSPEHDVYNPDALYEEFLLNTSWAAQAIIPHRLPDIYIDGQFDMLLVDGEHTYEATKRDLAAYLPTVKPGGVALVHDCCMDEVKRAMFEALQCAEIIEPPKAHFMARARV